MHPLVKTFIENKDAWNLHNFLKTTLAASENPARYNVGIKFCDTMTGKAMLEEIRQLEAQGVPEDDYADLMMVLDDMTVADLEALMAFLHAGYHRAQVMERLEEIGE